MHALLYIACENATQWKNPAAKVATLKLQKSILQSGQKILQIWGKLVELTVIKMQPSTSRMCVHVLCVILLGNLCRVI